MLIIDVQGFKCENNKFLVKELAAFNGSQTCHYIFKSPFNFYCLPLEYQQQAKWVTAHHHTIDWNQGYTPFHQFPHIMKQLTNNVEEIYVKGAEKARFLQRYTKACVIELPESPPLSPSDCCCFYHKKQTCICALSNVYSLYNIFVMK